MNYITSFAIVFAFYELGNFIAPYIPFPLPGSICGMLFLLLALCSKVLKVEWVEPCSNVFFKYLAFFFVPSGVALINSLDLISENILALLSIGIIATIMVQSITGVLLQKMLGGAVDVD